MITPTYLKDNKDAGITDDAMYTLTKLIDAYDEAEQASVEADKIAKAKKAALNELMLDRIPEFLLQHGIKKMVLSDGREVTIKEDISPTIKDNGAFVKWLQERGDDDIVKTKYSIGKMSSKANAELSEFLLIGEYDYSADISVHPATRKAYLKTLLAGGMQRVDLPECINIYDIRKAVIK